MDKKHLELVAKMLDLASDSFGNNCCNDIEDSIYEGWTLEERRQFVKEYHEYNGDPEKYDENFLHIGDYAIMGFFANKLRKEIKNEN